MNQTQIIQAMSQPAFYPHGAAQIERIETHISTVFLAGDYAYKVKKSVNFGFLDFSTLALRQQYCQEELRLNQRLAPDLYLAIDAIYYDGTHFNLTGEGEVVEYAIRMQRFNRQLQFDNQLSHGALELKDIEALAEFVADFHNRTPSAPQDSHYGNYKSIVSPMRQNFEQIRSLTDEPDIHRKVEKIERWTKKFAKRGKSNLKARKASGFIKECHGDMHLSNITHWQGQPMIFDGIEFNPDLYWIDTINEIAFLTMDLDKRGAYHLSHHFLNVYLERTGDYEGIMLLRFYQAYRALVRAKVCALSAHNCHLSKAEANTHWKACRDYLKLAKRYTKTTKPMLCITHGVSGSGKSTLAQEAVDELGFIRLRSDVERKRLAGIDSQDRSHSGLESGLYTPEMTEATYTQLVELSRLLLQNNFSVVVDATFLTRQNRAPFQELAAELGCHFLILCTETTLSVLESRIQERLQAGIDPSEANLSVLSRQLTQSEPLVSSELGLAVTIDTAESGSYRCALEELKRLIAA